MATDEDVSLREYLHLMARRVKDPPCIDKYDEFLIMVWEFFNLRVAAEDFYNNNRHVAYSRKGALPVSWQLIKETWEHGSPPEQVITLIAKRNYADVRTLISNLRKVLNRVRQKVSIGRVQQVDPHCLRWLTRQPGRSAIEKGGARQEILGIVRVENYNTLENRVFKDFLARCIALTTMYLRRYESDYPEHPTIVAVRRLKSLCIGGLAIPELEGVQELHEFPQPNYVLQQDRVYSRIWASYVDILRLEDVAERLWDKRKDIASLYERCNSLIAKHCSPRAKYNTPLWINELDGRKDIIENPIWDNEIGTKPVCLPAAKDSEYVCGDTAIIDFTNPWDRRDALFYPLNHRNARPYLQNPHQPSLEPGTSVSLHKILRTKNANQLEDYFIQLDGEFRKKRWVVLVPDDWESEWLESIIRARPWNLTSRDSIFLLWRSVAAVLGYLGGKSCSDGDTIVVVDGHRVPDYNAVTIRLMKEEGSDRVLPQRSSVRLHGEGSADVRFKLNRPFSDTRSMFSIGGDNAKRLVVGLLNKGNLDIPNTEVEYISNNKGLLRGVKKYLQDAEKGLVSYFDELDGLSLVTQTRFEEIEFTILVEHNECWPGGRPYVGERTRGGSLQQGATNVSLNLLEGEVSDNALLKTLQEEFDAQIPMTQDFFYQATVTPGQGLATVMFSADFLRRPIPLDLTKLESIGLTKARIEREMRRHFPPVMPYVEASEDMWYAARREIDAYMTHDTIPGNKSVCYKPQPYWGDVGEQTYRHYGTARWFNETECSPIDKLKREHVFGNSRVHPLPRVQYDFDALFNKMANDYQYGRDVLRLIAWTYQGDNPVFEFMRRAFHCSYAIRGMALEIKEITFCANNFADGDPRVADILRKVIAKIANGTNSEEEYRLAYNLLQFHPAAIENIPSDLCELAFMRVYSTYNTTNFFYPRGYWRGGSATKKAGYLLKCMLFLLHRRRYDPQFLLRAEDWEPNGFLAERLPTHTETLRGHEAMRKSFLNYVRGHGSIDGIPLGD